MNMSNIYCKSKIQDSYIAMYINQKNHLLAEKLSVIRIAGHIEGDVCFFTVFKGESDGEEHREAFETYQFDGILSEQLRIIFAKKLEHTVEIDYILKQQLITFLKKKKKISFFPEKNTDLSLLLLFLFKEIPISVRYIDNLKYCFTKPFVKPHLLEPFSSKDGIRFLEKNKNNLTINFYVASMMRRTGGRSFSTFELGVLDIMLNKTPGDDVSKMFERLMENIELQLQGEEENCFFLQPDY